MLVNMRKMRKN